MASRTSRRGDLDALFDAGAEVDLPLVFVAEPGDRDTFEVRMPPGLRVVDTGDAARVPQGLQVAIDARGEPAPVEQHVAARVASADATPPTANAGSADVTVDVRDVDVSLAGVAGGELGTMTIEVTARVALDAFMLPTEAVEKLPDGLRLSGLTASSVRALLERRLVERADLDEAADTVGGIFAERVAAALGGVIPVAEAAWDEASLTRGASGAPLVIVARATVIRPLDTTSPQRGAALTVYTLPLTFSLQRLEGLDTTWRLVLPDGLEATSATAGDGAVTTERLPDGRHAVVVVLSGDDDAERRTTVDVQVGVTPSFVAAHFWPVLVLATVVFAAGAGGIVWAVRRRRTKAA
ncbi:MAG TPA: hypothetical protein VI997_07180 [Candidatus Thermoplasmatota archaeon]|nr:hypothetical protein [Candidatus Thermoplasmatota archaeon]